MALRLELGHLKGAESSLTKAAGTAEHAMKRGPSLPHCAAVCDAALWACSLIGPQDVVNGTLCQILNCHVGSRYQMLHLDDLMLFLSLFRVKLGQTFGRYLMGKENTII